MLTRWRQNRDLWGGEDKEQSSVSSSLQHFRDRMEQLYREFESGLSSEEFGLQSLPKCSIYDTESSIIVKADVPGLSKDEIDVSVQDNILTIRGEHEETVPEDYSVHRRERGSVKFVRRMTLPSEADLERSSAELKDGVLTITLEKAEHHDAKKIHVDIK